MSVAYSYLRFSSPQQATGDSIRRQTEARERWLQAHPNVPLDTSLVMTDAGRSGWDRKDSWDTYALAQFKQHITSRRVLPGSYLLVENLDRLSRENVGDATELFLYIVNRGIIVVQLMPVVVEFKRPVDMPSLMYAVMELSRGHSESQIKSERVGAAWARKKRDAASRIVTRRLPGWVKYEAGRLVLDKAAAKIVQRVYQMARDGLGTAVIAQMLNKERVPVLGRKTFKGQPVMWGATVVYHLLSTRTVLGEYQPRSGRGSIKNRQLSGEPVARYYPAVVDADTFYAVQAALKRRATAGRGRRGKSLNLFAGLLKDAHDGGSLTYKNDRTKPTVLVPVGARQGRGVAWASFPAKVFEEQLLRQLHEIKARDLFPNGDAVQKVESLAGQVAEAEALIKTWTAKMDNPDIADIVAGKLAEFRVRQRELTEQLAQAQRDAASPASESWGEMRSLVEMLAEVSDQEAARQRLRAALRRVIEGVWCLFAGRGAVRVAAVEVWFTNGKRRCFLIGHEQPYPQAIPPRAAQTWSVVMDGPWATDTGTANSLRDPKKVRQVVKNLATFTVPEYAALVDAVGDATVRAALACDPAALLASLEYMDPEQLPDYAVARLRAVAGSAVELGWPVFKA
jgi:DNA invertase Pin-like site-specific DNA recombinase